MQIDGTIAVVQEIRREDAAKMMEPPVTARHLQSYIHLATLFLDEFAQFRNLETGGLSYRVKLTHLHIPILQRIRAGVWANGLPYTRIDLAKNPDKYRGINHEYNSSSPETEVQADPDYQRTDEEVSGEDMEARHRVA